MQSTLKHILDQAIELPASERTILAEQILLSLDLPGTNISTLWAAEAESRIEGYEKGEIETKKMHQFFSKTYRAS